MLAWRQALAREGVALFESPEQARAAADLLGRSTPLEVLRPRCANTGWSLSGTYGYTAFPWHTDAAVALSPPRWFVLSAVDVSEPTNTEVLLPTSDILKKLRRGLLTVRSRSGNVRYLPAAVVVPYGHRLRWDPRVASPHDSDLLAEVDAQDPTSAIQWRPGLSVIVDNHRTMHRRPAVDYGTDRTLTRYYVWMN